MNYCDLCGDHNSYGAKQSIVYAASESNICPLKPDVHHSNVFCFQFEDETVKYFQGNELCFMCGTCKTHKRNFMNIYCKKINQQHTLHYFNLHVKSDTSLFYSDIVSEKFHTA